ncbi:DUF6266 family protein [Parapedobacter sp. DT-150]|uniref:DUF6266 family protein n=1 Tax=Parapedobacter sp. DT-150 TaxID=3396162 RepID=UPI003F1DB2AF
MAKLIDLLTFSGRVGDMVGCMGPTGFYLRKRPKKSAKPPTARQLETRARMTMVMRFLSPLREIIYRGFASPTDRGSKTGALSRATALAITHAVAGEYPDLYIDAAHVQLTRGTLRRLLKPSVTTVGTLLKLAWTPNVDHFGNAFADDVVYMLIYQAKEGVLLTGEATRDAGEVAVDISAEPLGSRLLVYACTAERDHKRFSDSQYLGEIER